MFLISLHIISLKRDITNKMLFSHSKKRYIHDYSSVFILLSTGNKIFNGIFMLFLVQMLKFIISKTKITSDTCRTLT